MSPDQLYGLDPLTRHAVIVGVAGLVTLIVYGAEAWWSGPRRREARLRKWAQRQVSTYQDAWLAPLRRQAVVNRRVGAVGGFFSLVFLLEIPIGGQPYAAWLLAAPAVFSILWVLTSKGLALAPGTRVARLRELEITDFLPERTRVLMWIAGIVGFAACLLVGISEDARPLCLAGSLLLVAPTSVELAARRLAKMPEPAESAAHLYLQDVVRADQIKWAAFSATQASSFACTWLSMAVEEPGWLELTLTAMSLGLLVVLFPVMLNPDVKAAIYMRSRLWPQLGPGQLVADGEPMAAMGATS